MKLIFCKECKSIFSLSFRTKLCDCKKSWGNYLQDGLNAHYGGEAVPLGFTNNSFTSAVKRQPVSGDGTQFTAFVIPTVCPTFIQIKTALSNGK